MHLKRSHRDISVHTKENWLKNGEEMPFYQPKNDTKTGVTAAHFDFAVLSSGYEITCA